MYNRVEFSRRGLNTLIGGFPVLRMTIYNHDKSDIVEESFIYWNERQFVCFQKKQNKMGNSPFIDVEGIRDPKLLKGQLALCVMDHLFIIDDLLQIQTACPNLSGRHIIDPVDSFIADTMKAIRTKAHIAK